jgi:hypothetical protein
MFQQVLLVVNVEDYVVVVRAVVHLVAADVVQVVVHYAAQYKRKSGMPLGQWPVMN